MKGTTHEIKTAFKKQLPSVKVSVRTKSLGNSWYENVTIKADSALTKSEYAIAQSIVSEFYQKSYINNIELEIEEEDIVNNQQSEAVEGECNNDSQITEEAGSESKSLAREIVHYLDSDKAKITDVCIRMMTAVEKNAFYQILFCDNRYELFKGKAPSIADDGWLAIQERVDETIESGLGATVDLAYQLLSLVGEDKLAYEVSQILLGEKEGKTKESRLVNDSAHNFLDQKLQILLRR